ncbi:MAG: hypothetical protein ACRD0Z_17195 [Acidimicrobiales bacterium]
MPRLTASDELLAHQLLDDTASHHPHWRESYFFVAHRPDAIGDLVILTMATFPQREVLDSLPMGRVAGEQVIDYHARAYDGDPHTPEVGATRVEIVKPFEEAKLWADPDQCTLGMDLVFRARTKPYGLRRGTMRAGQELIWDQSHMFQSGTYNGTYSYAGTTYEVEDWWGQRDHSWGVRDHGRCPLWLWFQVQLPDGFLGVWHWELANGTVVYTDGCWAATDGSEPVPLMGFEHDLEWVEKDGTPAVYGEIGATVTGLRGSATFTLEGGRSVRLEAEGSFDRPYEPFHRGGLNQMKVRTDDGREGTAIFEVTGARHHKYFPDTVVPGVLPA